MNSPASKWSPVNPRPLHTYQHTLYARNETTTDFSRFTFDTIRKFTAYEVFQIWDWKDGEKFPELEAEDIRYLNKERCVTSKDVFENPQILPITPILSLPVLRRDRRFTELCSVHCGGIRQKMYRINDTTICDAYGRVFILNRSGFWVWKPLNLGADHRGVTTIGGISKPSYYWPGVAGYNPDVQAKIFDTPSIEIHHTTENTFIFAPSMLAPMPASLHRDFVHYTPLMKDYLDFFSFRRSPWYRINLYPRINKR